MTQTVSAEMPEVVTLHTVSAVLRALSEALVRQKGAQATLDAKALRSFDSSAVAMLLELRRALAQQGGQLRLVNVPRKLQELVALSKKEDLSFAVTATGSAPHLAGVELARATGARWEYVPYKGGVQSIQDTVAGQTQVLMNGMLATYPHVQSGKLKLLGLSKGTRMPLAANVPTIAEQGVPGFESGTWQGILAPRSMPDPIASRVGAELAKIINQPDIKKKLGEQGAEVVVMNPADLDAFFNKERARWAEVVAKADIRLD